MFPPRVSSVGTYDDEQRHTYVAVSSRASGNAFVVKCRSLIISALFLCFLNIGITDAVLSGVVLNLSLLFAIACTTNAAEQAVEHLEATEQQL